MEDFKNSGAVTLHQTRDHALSKLINLALIGPTSRIHVLHSGPILYHVVDYGANPAGGVLAAGVLYWYLTQQPALWESSHPSTRGAVPYRLGIQVRHEWHLSDIGSFFLGVKEPSSLRTPFVAAYASQIIYRSSLVSQLGPLLKIVASSAKNEVAPLLAWHVLCAPPAESSSSPPPAPPPPLKCSQCLRFGPATTMLTGPSSVQGEKQACVSSACGRTRKMHTRISHEYMALLGRHVCENPELMRRGFLPGLVSISITGGIWSD